VANYLAAILIVAAVALFVAAPLSGGFPRRRRATSLQLDLERLEHERGLAVQGLRELEFDHEMGKLDEVDYRDLQRALEDRALSAMTAIERARTADRNAERAAERRRAAARLSRPASARARGIAPASSAAPALSTVPTPNSSTVTAPAPDIPSMTVPELNSAPVTATAPSSAPPTATACVPAAANALASSPATDRTNEHGRAGGSIACEADLGVPEGFGGASVSGIVPAPSSAPATGSAATSGPAPAASAHGTASALGDAMGTPSAPVGQPAAMPPPAPRASTTRRMPGAAHPPLVNFCPQCGVRVGAGHNFCAACGANLSPATARIASRAE